LANVLLTFTKLIIKVKMHAKILFFGVWKAQYDFLALRHLAVCTKHFFYVFNFFVFWKFWWKQDILIPDLYFYEKLPKYKKILPDITQNDIKTTRENCKILKQIFFNFFKWAGSGPNAWAGPNLAQLHGLG
jgi:hypothetical protein